jgi:hypothetical protein
MKYLDYSTMPSFLDRHFSKPGMRDQLVMKVNEPPCDNHCGTCLALDLPHPLFEGFGGLLRQYYKALRPSTGAVSCSLALCPEVCGFLLVEEMLLQDGG